ncbi:MAG: ROK family protein [Actinobacteria bacterium]|nr:ROK family protein [Actinomycetota bacterium]
MPILGLNAKLGKKVNRELVLKTIYNYRLISRAGIANITGLTPASITKIVNEFLDIGIVREISKGKTFSGRKPVFIDINSDSYFIIGVYIARKSINGIITNLNAEIIKRVEYNKSLLEDPNLPQEVIKLIDELLKISGINKEKVLGIGMAVPGPINSKSGEVIYRKLSEGPPYVWVRVPLTEAVLERFGIPVFADNDSNASAVGESWFGSGMEFKNFILISFGEGLGGGLILKNRLYRGEDDIVGEIGHITIDVNGPKCNCGNFGCLELFTKNKTIIEKYNVLSKKYPNSKLTNKHIVNVEDIYNFEDKNDPLYNEILDYQATYLGIGIVNIINVLNPQAVIIITNEIKKIDINPLLEKISDFVRKRAFPVVREKVKIIPGKLGNDAQLIGSISLVLRDFFNLRDF